MSEPGWRAWLAAEADALLGVGSVGLYHLLAIMRSSGAGMSQESMRDLASDVVADLVGRGSAQLSLLRWPLENPVAGPLPLTELGDPAVWTIASDGHYWALTSTTHAPATVLAAAVTGQDPRPVARTLAEAYAYLELTMPQGEEWIDFRRHSVVDRDAEQYVLRYDGPYGGEHVVREVAFPLGGLADPELPVSYGDGPSQLIDAGQWLLLEMAHAGQALAGQRRAHPADRPTVVRAWESARAAVDEIKKFLPPGADDVPATAVWTDQGRHATQLWPGALTRARLDQASEIYRQHCLDLDRAWPASTGSATQPRLAPPPGLFPGSPLPARSYAEVHAYLDVLPCACGAEDFDRSALEILSDREASALGAPATEVVVRYAGPCQGCGQPRDVLFRLPRRAGLPAATGYGEPEDGPSRLLDAGQWLGMAHAYAHFADLATKLSRDSGVPLRDPTERQTVLQYLTTAAQAVDEVLKFVPPDAQHLPASAFWDDDSRAWARAEPDRFSADQLRQLQAQRWRLVAEFLDQHPVES